MLAARSLRAHWRPSWTGRLLAAAHPRCADVALAGAQGAAGRPFRVVLAHTAAAVERALRELDLAGDAVLGLDCEWGRHRTERRGVALLQLAGRRGVLLVKTRALARHALPAPLLALLADEAVLKSGVAVLNDARRLQALDRRLAVAGLVDLAHLYRRNGMQDRGSGLKALAQNALGVDLPKAKAVQVSDWDAAVLSSKQVEYAALDAVASRELFLACHRLALDGAEAEAAGAEALGRWARPVSSGPAGASGGGKRKGGGSGSGQTQKQQLAADERKDARRAAFRTPELTQPLYDNCRLLAPDGELLCLTDTKKARWYLDRGLGRQVGERPLTVQLTFEPKGRNAQGYAAQPKANRCVVCGHTGKLARHYVVPHRYRKHLPLELKSHASHDVVLLCQPHHTQVKATTLGVSRRLHARYGVEMRPPRADGPTVDQDKRGAAKAAKALTVGDRLPAARRAQLEGVVREFLRWPADAPIDPHSPPVAALRTLDCALPGTPPLDSEAPWRALIAAVAADDNLRGFVLEYRRAFVEEQDPQHLPEGWAVSAALTD